MNESTAPDCSSSCPADTRTRLLDAAEDLYATEGFNVSVRSIIQRAEVNLAAIHYHFGGKDALLKAVLERRLVPLNAERLAMLDALEAAFPEGELPLERVLLAFLEPPLRWKFDQALHSENFIRIVGRLYAETDPQIHASFHEAFETVIARFHAAFCRALPLLSEMEVLRRMFLVVATLAHTLLDGGMLRGCLPLGAEPAGMQEVLTTLVAYHAAGMRVRTDAANEPPSNPGGEA